MQPELMKNMCLKKICGEQLNVKQQDSYHLLYNVVLKLSLNFPVASQRRNLGFNADNLMLTIY